MKKGLFGCLLFLLGAGTGAAVTYTVLKDKTEKEINTEVQKFKDDWIKDQVDSLYFRPIPEEEKEKAKEEIEKLLQKVEKDAEIISKARKLRDKPPITDYSKMFVIDEEKGVTIGEYLDKSGIIVDTPKDHPHIISEYDFVEDKEFDKLHYILYADGILADEDGEIIEYDIEGNENYIDPDVVYGFLVQEVTDEFYYRNEEFGRDFEILKSARLYNEG